MLCVGSYADNKQISVLEIRRGNSLQTFTSATRKHLIPKICIICGTWLEKIILCRQVEIMCRLIFHQDEFFGLSVPRSLRLQSLCRFASATNVFITYDDRQGSGGAAPEAGGSQVLSSPSEKIFNALRTLEAMW